VSCIISRCIDPRLKLTLSVSQTRDLSFARPVLAQFLILRIHHFDRKVQIKSEKEKEAREREREREGGREGETSRSRFGMEKRLKIPVFFLLKNATET
jgi:hypothetical protein